jgi:hypothetical protein
MQQPVEKQCSRCEQSKPIEEFPWKHRARGVRRAWCRSCARAYAQAHYQANKRYYKAKAHKSRVVDRKRVRGLVVAYLASHPCIDCGEDDTAVLEFDHRDPLLKRSPVSTLATSAGWKNVLREIEKCDVRCANCHRQKTALEFGWTRIRPLPEPDPEPIARRVERIDQAGADFMRECSWCLWLKPLSEFAFRNSSTGRLNGHCRNCHALYRRQHYVRNRDRYFGQARAQTLRKRADALQRIRSHLLSHHCVDCGETEIAALDFDHVDPSNKITEIGTMVGHQGWAAIKAEITKCVVRCANCHRRRTNAQIRAA